VCSPIIEGGLGLRSLSTLNEASNLKLCWEMMESTDQWAHLLRHRVFKNFNVINYHIFSSIWCGIKSKVQIILDNSCWIIGNGSSIKFWTHDWSGSTLMQFLNISSDRMLSLHHRVQDFIVDSHWLIPMELQLEFPNLLPYLQNISIPLIEKDDHLIWKHSPSGSLSLKDAYNFVRPPDHLYSWAKLIWNTSIPPSKSLLLWRLFHNKLPTDENLTLRGCNLPSICSLCLNQAESSHHLFLNCPFALSLWNWLGSITHLSINLNSLSEAFEICNRGWSPQCKLVIIAAFINIINIIWLSRNNLRFNNIKPVWNSVIAWIVTNVNMTGNQTSLTTNSSISDFSVLKAFKVKTHSPKAHRIIEVLWHPPLLGWVKCNTDGAAHGSPSPSACGGLFINYHGVHLGSFAEFLGNSNAFAAELHGVMCAIEPVFDRGWHSL
jgi:hypothetical protein